MSKHDMSEYWVWSNMKQRCTNPNNKSWKHYGGRGITVCEEWINSFDAFFAYVGSRPSHSHTIDRIDNNGDYTDGNVRWATRSEQNSNRRKYKHKKKKSHCPHGHEYNAKNTRVMKGGERRCRVCIATAARIFRASHPDAASSLSKRNRKNA